MEETEKQYGSTFIDSLIYDSISKTVHKAQYSVEQMIKSIYYNKRISILLDFFNDANVYFGADMLP